MVCEFAVQPREGLIERYRVRLLEFLQSLVPAVFKINLAVLAARAVEATLVNQAMMVAAQQYEVIEARFATIRPVLDMVTVAEFVTGAAWKPATTVPGL